MESALLRKSVEGSLEHPVTERLAASSKQINKEVIAIDKTMKCQLLVFSLLFEVKPLQGRRDGCFDSFSTDSSRLCARNFACTHTKNSRHVPIAFKKLNTFGGVM